MPWEGKTALPWHRDSPQRLLGCAPPSPLCPAHKHFGDTLFSPGPVGTLWGCLVSPSPVGHSRATQCPPVPCWGAPCPLALCRPNRPHSPAPLHIWDGDTDGSPCTPQEGSDTCTLLWAGVTEPPVIYFYTVYYNSCFYSFVPFVLCLVELHVPVLPMAAQGPRSAA